MLAAAAIVATVVLGAQTWHKAFRPGGNDLTSYLLSARPVGRSSPYGLDALPVYLSALSGIRDRAAGHPSYGAAVIGWFAASVAALGAILWPDEARHERSGRWTAGSAVAASAAVLVTFNIIQNNLLNGQVNFFVVLCCVLAVKQTRATAAGAWLGAAIALKLMPALLLVYFLVRRQFRAILVAAATALVLALAPAVPDPSGSGAEWSPASAGLPQSTRSARGLLMPMMTARGDAALAYSIASVVQRVLAWARRCGLTCSARRPCWDDRCR